MDNGIAYLEETFGCQSIVHPWGFVCYTQGIEPGSCYIHSYYIAPEHRGTGKAQELLEELKQLAKGQGYLSIIANTWLHIANPQASIIAQLGSNFVPYKADNDNIWFRLDLKEGE